MMSKIDEVYKAYKSGKMSPEDEARYREYVEIGKIQLPEGIVDLDIEPVVEKPRPTIGQRVKDVFTGELRETPETETLQDIGYLPELHELSLKGLRTALGKLISPKDEFVSILKKKFPKVTSRTDEKGNFIIKSSIDGKEYAIKPGLQVSDIPGIATQAILYALAAASPTTAGQIGGAMATEAAIQGVQKLLGGKFDYGEIPAAGAGAGIFHKAGQAIKGLFKGAPKTIPEATDIQDLAETIRKASKGSEKAKQAFIAQSAPDPEIVTAAKKLGVEEYLQPDQVSKDQSFKEIVQAVKSIPGSKARQLELEGLKKVGERADELIEELGGKVDLSQLDINVKSKMKELQEGLEEGAEKLYNKLNETIPQRTRVEAKNLLKFLEKRADDLGGVKSLSAQERELIKQLKNPTYGRLDKIRKEFTLARVKKAGAFKEADTGLIKKFESELLKDQKLVAKNYGMEEVFNTARSVVAGRKKLENDIKLLYGKAIDKSLLTPLTAGFQKLGKGDTSKFIKTIQSIPDEMKEEVVTSGLNIAFGKNAKNNLLNPNSYANWFESLQKNKQAYNALMTNLPKGAEESLRNLYKVSDGIRKASRERITTGRLRTISETIKGADNLISRVYDQVKFVLPVAALETITSYAGLPGAGIMSGVTVALTAAILKKKKYILRAADELISSPEFIGLAATGSAEAAEKLAKSMKWKNFVRGLKEPRKLSNPEKWLLSSWQATKEE